MRVSGVLQGRHFNDALELLICVKITTRKLYLMAYSSNQKWLFERVRALRDRRHMTFDAIAKMLSSEQVLSPRGCSLMAEHVFSIYKKGRLRGQRLTEQPTAAAITAQ